jgi:S-adenosylmethionine:tRNA ribosyltransferase-isomerase
MELLEIVGRVPLPHYIRDGNMLQDDIKNYQTVFATKPGSVAAPTAGLHLTKTLINRLIDSNKSITRVTLHVGIGTFRPVNVPKLSEHVMHSEWGQIDEKAIGQIEKCRQQGGRVIAVGTTTTRILETAARHLPLKPWSGATDIFIRPGFEFHAIDGLLTNFHLPRSTLLVLVRTFGGDELIQEAYRQAIEEKYRFFSYGDAMLIL